MEGTTVTKRIYICILKGADETTKNDGEMVKTEQGRDEICWEELRGRGVRGT